jgi:uncharacterized protein YneF (UPF0154 family)
MFEFCVPPSKLFDVAVIFYSLGFVVGYAVGVIAAFIAIKRRKGQLNEKEEKITN